MSHRFTLIIAWSLTACATAEPGEVVDTVVDASGIIDAQAIIDARPTDAAPGDASSDASVVDAGAQAPGDALPDARSADAGPASPDAAPILVDAAPGAERCDGVDTDGDGRADEGFADLGQPCTAGVGGCAVDGVFVCNAAGDGVTCDARPEIPFDETCDGTDEDCDGFIDEGLPEPACTAGVGACTRDGAERCVAGVAACDATPGPMANEICDRLDNDCDGATDEGGICAVCGDGRVDAGEGCDDGNQVAGDGCAADCTVEQIRHVLRCGRSGRDVSAFVQPADGLPIIEGCAPAALTQAMLVTREGTARAVADPPALRAYLRAGGNVLTEWGGADEVFNAVTNGRAVQGAQRGQCQDDVNPPVRLNLADRFWLNNAAVDAHRGGTGCGFDLAAFPGIVPLGGWARDQVSLAYVSVGQGRLWLVETDWQDNQDISPESLALMRSMILWNDGLMAGIHQDLPRASLANGGWRQCWRGTYADSSAIADVQGACAGGEVLMACGPVDQPNYTLAAAGLDAEVWRDVGPANDASNAHNGVRWYFSGGRSWGFGPIGEPVFRNSCDTARTLPELRMCWHTNNDRITSGYRCGHNTLNGNETWERVLYVRDALAFRGVRQGVPEAELLDGGFAECWASDYRSTVSIAEILAGCDQGVLLMGCRGEGTRDLTVAAMGDRAEVIRDTGVDPAGVNLHNDVQWYFNGNRSWGFAPAGVPVNRNGCDTGLELQEQRLCWHTRADDVSSGWSCGVERGLPLGARVIYHRPGAVGR